MRIALSILLFACYLLGNAQSYYSKNITSRDGLPDNAIRSIFEDSRGYLWIGTDAGVSRWDGENFSTKNGALEKEVIITSILENDSCVEIYNFRNNHYCIYFDDSIPFISEITYGDKSKYRISSVFQSKNGYRYFGWKRKGAVKQHNSSFAKIPGIGQVFGITEDCSGDIWAASWNGGGAISPPGELFVIVNDNPTRLNSAYSINSVLGWSAFFEKNQNLILYGTLDKGLYKIPPQYFEYYPPIYFGENNLSISDVEISSDNSIWFITDSLLVIWDGSSFEKFTHDSFYNVKLRHIANSGSSDDLKQRISNLKKHYINRNTYFYDIEFDSNDDVWITTENLGLFKIPDKNPDKVIYHSNYVYRDFAFDKTDTLFQCDAWSSSFRKFIDFKRSSEFTNYRDSLHPIFSKNIYNYQNELWACSRISDVFMLKEGKLRTITTEDSTINKIVNDICVDTEGYAYLGGSDGSIEVLAPETREKIFEINHEEYDNSVHWVKVSRNMLFVGYSDGLRVYRLEDIVAKKQNCRFFTESEGYLVHIVNSSVVDKDSNIWLATNDGLVKIATELFVECYFQPLTTVIQKVDIFNNNTNWEQYSPSDAWTGLPLETAKLDPDQNHISIYFHTLNYNNPDADHYYYKLEGVDKEWIGPSDKKYVVYPYLRSGSYKFMVKSKNELSGLTTQTAAFSFIIQTPWYKQIWYYILLAAIIFASFTLFYKLRLMNMRKKEEDKRDVLQKISELEIKALQAQMNPHFLFNSINSIQSYILDNDVDEALTYLSSFSKIIRMTLEFVDRKFVSLSNVLDYLQHYVILENMRFDELFDYVVICDKDIDPDTTLMLPMLLQPIIENSIMHGIMQLKQKGIIKLEIQKVDDHTFKCIIEDNGIGRTKSAQNNKRQKVRDESIGLKITKERLDILNNGKDGHFKIEIIDLYSDNGESAGTRVEITLAFMLN